MSDFLRRVSSLPRNGLAQSATVIPSNGTQGPLQTKSMSFEEIFRTYKAIKAGQVNLVQTGANIRSIKDRIVPALNVFVQGYMFDFTPIDLAIRPLKVRTSHEEVIDKMRQ